MNGVEVLFVDHSGLPGGGQLGLRRYLERPESAGAGLVLLGGGDAFDRLSASGVTVRTLSQRLEQWRLPLTAGALWRVLRHSDAELVVANSVKAACVMALVPRRRGQHWIYYMRDDLNPRRNSRLKLLVLTRLVLPRFQGFLANSRWTASTLPAHLATLPLQIAYPVSGAGDTAPGPDRSSAPGELRLLSLSRLAHWKGIHVLLEAIGVLERRGRAAGIRVTIAGSSAHADPSYEHSLKTAAAELQTPVRFTGHVDDVTTLLADADCLVSVSLTPEPFGQVIAQGMLAGLVVIAGDEGGASEQITDGESGLLVTPDNAEALADALQALRGDHGSIAAMSVRARTSAQRFADVETVSGLRDALRVLGAAMRVGRQRRGDEDRRKPRRTLR